jgi:hypothetical protein
MQRATDSKFDTKNCYHGVTYYHLLGNMTDHLILALSFPESVDCLHLPPQNIAFVELHTNVPQQEVLFSWHSSVIHVSFPVV